MEKLPNACDLVEDSRNSQIRIELDPRSHNFEKQNKTYSFVELRYEMITFLKRLDTVFVFCVTDNSWWCCYVREL